MSLGKIHKQVLLKKYKLPLEISLAVLIWLIALTVFCTLMDIQPTVFYTLQGHMSADVTHENGEMEHFEDGDFGCVYYGDQLLRITADAIMESFSENGFASRWGGDEFVACVYDKEENAVHRIEEFQAKIRKLDQEGGYPFKISVACGHIGSYAESYLAPIEAIRLADERMYENKRRMKAQQA